MDSQAVLARFAAERQALTLMDHPSVARVYDAGQTDTGRPWFAMELVAGEPITDWCARASAARRTRIGLMLKTGIVTVDPTVVPLRSWVYVPGYGKGIAGDTGGGVKGKFIDLGYSEGEYKSWPWWTDVYLLWRPPPSHHIRWLLPDWPRYPDRRR